MSPITTATATSWNIISRIIMDKINHTWGGWYDKVLNVSYVLTHIYNTETHRSDTPVSLWTGRTPTLKCYERKRREFSHIPAQDAPSMITLQQATAATLFRTHTHTHGSFLLTPRSPSSQ